ncbi:hypothetical protein LAU_0434 [Lausannevirus]|uniref:BTB domain-containing protein n=1 Tax=Lausannevirus TaxID=999883 RepID=F2WM11_9VIRU|nr:hypothetical protein LAU_0434 [Lausannevirus]AEA07284.1 hypothetical protein LAU_0434 [Lausannevirus]
MQDTVLLKSLEGVSFPFKREELAKKSLYFEALFRNGWSDSERQTICLDIPFARLERILDFVFEVQEAKLKEKDKKYLSFYFPGVPFFKVKKELEFSKGTCKTLFSQYMVTGVYESGKYHELCSEIFEVNGGFLVMKPPNREAHFKEAVTNISKFSIAKVPYFRSGGEEYISETDGFWLWCYCCLFGYDISGQEILQETGLIIIPIHRVVWEIMSNGSNINSSGVLFEGPENFFVVLCDGKDKTRLPSRTEFAKYERDEEWMLPFKTFTIQNDVSLSRGFLMGKNFPKKAGSSKLVSTHVRHNKAVLSD